jgi:translation elongation factor EF-Tu-like GTPase
MSAPEFAMTVSAVFVIAGRGVIACGEDVDGQCENGSVVQICHGDQVLGQSIAFVELHTRPGTVALVLTDPNVHVQSGDQIKTAAG